MSILSTAGFEIHRSIFPAAELCKMRDEAIKISESAGSACVRGLLRRSTVFREMAKGPAVQKLIGPDLYPVRSILFDKTPGANWPVAWHQDLTITVKDRVEVEGYGSWTVKDGCHHVQPPVSVMEQMVTVRIHLDETGALNGPLRVIPGSHLKGRRIQGTVSLVDEESAVSCECSAGDVLIMRPLIQHSSRRAKTPGHRRVIHIEYARLDSLHPDLSWVIED